ncbi:MAG: PQQ-binding-like beta-propeller repeat protein, partial [Pirellulales bacterium]
YLKIVASGGPWDEMIEPDTHRRVRRDAWIRAQLTELVESAAPDQREAIDAAIRRQIDVALAGGRLASLTAAVAYFGAQPASATARLKLAGMLVEQGDMLAAEQHALPLAFSPDRATAASALAILGDLDLRANQLPLAAEQARRLQNDFGDVTLPAGGTGSDAAAAILAQLALRRESASASLQDQNAPNENRRPAPWPTGYVKVEIGKRTGNSEPRETQYQVPLVGPRGLAVGNGHLILERNAQRLIARDAWGSELLHVSMLGGPLAEEREIDPYVCVARERGHLLILSAGDRIVAINGLGSPADPLTTTAWEQPLATKEDDEDSPRSFGQRRRVERGQITKRWGEVEYRAIDSDANVLGVLGPITDAGVCYQRGRELVCVESATGKLVWTVENLPPGCELFGDEELLFAAPHDSLDGALVFRMADGQPLGQRQVPSEMSRMTTLGRQILVWGQHDGKLAIGLLDAWTGARSWNRPVAEGTVAQVLGDRVAILEPTGKFVVVDIATGNTALEQQLLAEYDESGQPRLVSLHVIASQEQMIVVANRSKSPDHSKDNKVRWINRQTPLVTGRVYALNPRTGAQQWPVPAEVEDQGLVTSQPPELPLLAFMRHVDLGESRERRVRFTTHVYCLDKRTGGAVMHLDSTTGYRFSRMDLDATSAYGSHWTADLAAGTATCKLPALDVTFRFTNQPIPPEPPAQLADRDPDGEAARQARAIGSFFKELGRRQADPGGRTPEDIFGGDDDLDDE